eukprot:NODE_571_length_6574_cov_0.317220.p3 type:complete len:134 gc:universal NODE_571_length_6574_cov_0.317220:2088-2489(+)
MVLVRKEAVSLRMTVISINLGDRIRGFFQVYSVFFIIGAVILGLLVARCTYNLFRRRKLRRNRIRIRPQESLAQIAASYKSNDEPNLVETPRSLKRNTHNIDIDNGEVTHNIEANITSPVKRQGHSNNDAINQ